MIRHTTLILAAVILAAAIATPAQANFVSSGQADNTKVSLTTTGTSKLKVTQFFTFECDIWTLTGSITPANRSTASFPVAGVLWSNCTATILAVQTAAIVTDSGSDWTMSVGTSAGATSFNMSITYPTSFSVTIPTTGCTFNWAKQAFTTGIAWTNSTHSLTVTLSSISYTSSNCAGWIPPSGTGLSLTASLSDQTLTITA